MKSKESTEPKSSKELLNDPKFLDFAERADSDFSAKIAAGDEEAILEAGKTFESYCESRPAILESIKAGIKDEYGFEIEGSLGTEFEEYVDELVHSDPEKFTAMAKVSLKHREISSEISKEETAIKKLLSKHKLSLDTYNLSNNPSENTAEKVLEGYEEKDKKLAGGFLNRMKDTLLWKGKDRHEFHLGVKEALSHLKTSVNKKNEMAKLREEIFADIKGNQNLKDAAIKQFSNSLNKRSQSIDLNDLTSIQNAFEVISKDNDLLDIKMTPQEREAVSDRIGLKLAESISTTLRSTDKNTFRSEKALRDKLGKVFKLEKIGDADTSEVMKKLLDDEISELNKTIVKSNSQANRELKRKLILISSIRKDMDA